MKKKNRWRLSKKLHTNKRLWAKMKLQPYKRKLIPLKKKNKKMEILSLLSHLAHLESIILRRSIFAH